MGRKEMHLTFELSNGLRKLADVCAMLGLELISEVVQQQQVQLLSAQPLIPHHVLHLKLAAITTIVKSADCSLNNWKRTT